MSVLLLVALVGCEPNEVAPEVSGPANDAPAIAEEAPTPEIALRSASLVPRSNLFVQSNSVALADDNLALVGMSGLTCGFTTTRARMITDDNYTPGEDEVEDADDDDDDDDDDQGTIILVRSGSGALTYVNDFQRRRLYGQGVLDAKLIADGLVARVELEPDVCRFERHLAEGIQGKATSCGGEFTVDRTTGTAFLADGEVTRLDSRGTHPFDAQGDQIAFDAATGMVYVAEAGTTEVVGLSASGEVQWSTAVPRNIVDLTQVGDTGALAILTEEGGVAVLEGANGDLIGKIWIGAGETITSSDVGATVAVRTRDQVSFLDVTFDR